VPIRPSAPQNDAPPLVAIPAEARHLELCALKSLAICSKPVLRSTHRGATLITPKPLASECPRHGVCRLVVQLFPSEERQRRWQTLGPTGVLNPAPKDRSGRLWEPSLVSWLPNLSPHTAQPKLAYPAQKPEGNWTAESTVPDCLTSA